MGGRPRYVGRKTPARGHPAELARGGPWPPYNELPTKSLSVEKIHTVLRRSET